MKLLLNFFFVLLLFINQNCIAQYKTGLVPSIFDSSMIVTKDFNFNIKLPNYFSLEKYSPISRNQQEGSCVAWACAYSALTITKKIENSISDSDFFDPMSLFRRLKAKNNEGPCTGGADIESALDMLKLFGCELNTNDFECNNKYELASKVFPNKLFEYEELDINVLNFKAVLNSNCPIVIGAKVVGYENKENLLANGVWNGSRTELSGYHAMSIIGYNDTIANGSFLVQNSWGADFGLDGKFWLRYVDLDIIMNAYCLRTKLNNQNKIQNFEVKTFRVNNNTDYTVYIAIATKINGRWISKGWFGVLDGDFKDFSIEDREVNSFYWIASANKGKYIWCGKGEANLFAYEPSKSFSYPENHVASNYINYIKADPLPGKKSYNQTLCLNSVVSRGLESVKSFDFDEFEIDNRHPDSANVYWERKFVLYDYYSNKIIKYNFNERGEKIFNIWFWEGNLLKNKIFTDEELERLSYFKFGSDKSAEAWKMSLKN